ncbi:MAG: hypothetical protein AAF721_17240 [Myxococcota bacterium]
MTPPTLARSWIGLAGCLALAAGTTGCRGAPNQILQITATETQLVLPVHQSAAVVVETEGTRWQEDFGNEMRVFPTATSGDESVAIVTSIDPEFHDLVPGRVQESTVTIECVGEGETSVHLDADTNPKSDTAWVRNPIEVTCFVDDVTVGTTGDTMTPGDDSSDGDSNEDTDGGTDDSSDITTGDSTDAGDSGDTGEMPGCAMGEATAPNSDGLILVEGTVIEIPISGDQADCPAMCSMMVTNGHFAEITYSITPWSPADDPNSEQSLDTIPTGETAEIVIVTQGCVTEAEDTGKSIAFFDDLNGLSFGSVPLELRTVLP